MAIITFLSDFGHRDHYVAAVKARIFSINPGIQIVDISHLVPPGDIGRGAFLLRNVYQTFPEGTVHLVGIDDPQEVPSEMIAVKADNHFFVGADNGLIGLVTDAENYLVSRISSSEKLSTFPCLDILAPVAAQLASGTAISDTGTAQPSFKKMLDRSLRATKTQIIGHVRHIDHYGNLITNIDRETFLTLSTNKRFHITFGRENIQRIHEGYHSVEPGDCFVIFNHRGLLEIGIKQGKAASLLGLSFDSPVIVHFQETNP